MTVTNAAGPPETTTAKAMTRFTAHGPVASRDALEDRLWRSGSGRLAFTFGAACPGVEHDETTIVDAWIEGPGHEATEHTTFAVTLNLHAIVPEFGRLLSESHPDLTIGFVAWQDVGAPPTREGTWRAGVAVP